MKILLLNDNPVVTKLVTLSAKKTSDELVIVGSTKELQGGDYGLLVIDDALYSSAVMQEIDDKITYNNSLYICSKNSDESAGFSSVLKKPFLPTDLVEKFVILSKESRKPVFNGTNSVLDLEELQEVQDLLEDEPTEIPFNYNVETVANKLSFTTDILLEFIEDFITQAREHKDILYTSLSDRDFKTLASTAHKLKGVAANLNIEEAYESLIIVNVSQNPLEIHSELEKLFQIIDKLDTFIHRPPEPEVVEEPEAMEDSEDSVDLGFDEIEIDDDNFELDSDISNLLDDIELDTDIALDDSLDIGLDDIESLDDDNLELDPIGSLDIEIEDEGDALSELDNLSLDDMIEEDEEKIAKPELEDNDTPEDNDIEVDDALSELDNLSLDDMIDEEQDITHYIEESEDGDTTFDAEDEEAKFEREMAELDEELEDIAEEIDEEEIVEVEEEIEEEIVEDSQEIEEESEQDIQDQIERAVSELSSEDLESEIDIDSLNSQDIKLAIGESTTPPTKKSSANGTEALKQLLSALSNEDVVASLDGMKININITIGGE